MNMSTKTSNICCKRHLIVEILENGRLSDRYRIATDTWYWLLCILKYSYRIVSVNARIVRSLGNIPVLQEIAFSDRMVSSDF